MRWMSEALDLVDKADQTEAIRVQHSTILDYLSYITAKVTLLVSFVPLEVIVYNTLLCSKEISSMHST
jgi:hypothetical protein